MKAPLPCGSAPLGCWQPLGAKVVLWEVAPRWGNRVFLCLCAAQGSAVCWIELCGFTEQSDIN